MTSDEFIQTLIKKLSAGFSFREQISEDEKHISDFFVEKLRNKLSSNYCVVILDIKDYDNFVQYFEDLTREIERALQDPEGNLGFSADDILKTKNPSATRTKFLLAVGKVVAKGKRLILVNKHYEEAADRWLGGFGFIRSLLSHPGYHVSAVMFTSKPMHEVSDEPEGSSPLWNIFNDLKELSDVVSSDTKRAEDTKETEFFLDFIGRGKYLRLLTKRASTKIHTHLSVFGLPHVGKSKLVEKWKKSITGGDDNIIGTLGVGAERKSLCFFHIPELHETSSYSAVVDLFLGQFEKFKEEYKKYFPGDASDEGTSEFSFSWTTSNGDSAPDEDCPAVTTTRRLRQVVDYINKLGFRVILIIDEFQETEITWDEKDYRQFCQLLLDTSLDLFCIIISRPHLSYIVNAHIYKLMPFKPVLVESYTDRELKVYLGRLWRRCNLGNAGAIRSTLAKPIRRLLVDCGKNPYLLNKAAMEIYNNLQEPSQKTIDQAVTDALDLIHGEILAFYSDTVDFMRDEEAKKLQSFTHIVKCYFGTSDDYEDVIDRYIDLGYVEKVGLNELLAETCKSFVRYDDNGNPSCYYTTVCQGFVDYLYTTQLDEIKDIRTLFTGLVHSFRHITEENLEKRLSNKVKGQPWYLQLMDYFFAYDGKERCYVEYNQNLGQLVRNPNISRSKNRRGQGYDSTNPHRFQISKTSLEYAMNELKKGGGGTELLDAINLYDHASIICQYSDAFCQYFSVVGDIEHDDEAMKLLRSCFEVIQDKIRNPISHYSRKKLSLATTNSHRELCTKLLESIHGFISGDPIADDSSRINTLVQEIRNKG